MLKGIFYEKFAWFIWWWRKYVSICNLMNGNSNNIKVSHENCDMKIWIITRHSVWQAICLLILILELCFELKLEFFVLDYSYIKHGKNIYKNNSVVVECAKKCDHQERGKKDKNCLWHFVTYQWTRQYHPEAAENCWKTLQKNEQDTQRKNYKTHFCKVLEQCSWIKFSLFDWIAILCMICTCVCVCEWDVFVSNETKELLCIKWCL